MSRILFDADSAVVLRDPTDDAEASTAWEATYFDLNVADGQVPYEQVDVLIRVTEAEIATGDETYTIQVRTSDDGSGSNTVVVGQVPTFGASGASVPEVTVPFNYVVRLDMPSIRKIDTDAAYLNVGVTVAGTVATGVKYGAYLIPVPPNGR